MSTEEKNEVKIREQGSKVRKQSIGKGVFKRWFLVGTDWWCRAMEMAGSLEVVITRCSVKWKKIEEFLQRKG